LFYDKREENKLLTVVMDFWRRSVTIARKNKISNHGIREKMDLQHSVLDDVKT
jgi:hypothetical protein